MNPRRYELSPLDVRMLQDYGVTVPVEDDPAEVEVELERGRQYDRMRRRRERAKSLQDTAIAGLIAAIMIAAAVSFLGWLEVL